MDFIRRQLFTAIAPTALGSRHYQPAQIPDPRLPHVPAADMRSHRVKQILEEGKMDVPLLTTGDIMLSQMEQWGISFYQTFRYFFPKQLVDISAYKESIADIITQSKNLVDFIEKFKEFLIQHFPALKKEADSFTDLAVNTIKLSQQFMKKMDAHPACKNFSNKDKYRALTNFWAYILFAHCCGVSIKRVTEDIFLESLLYPLTDNILDSDEIKSEIKVWACEIISDALSNESNIHPLKEKIKGHTDITEDLRDNITYVIDFIFKIKQQHSHSKNDPCGAFASLQVIHRLQMLSSKIQSKTTQSSFDKLLEATASKGAGSVMIDAYLLQHQLTEQQQALAILMGSLAQWLNDIEGIEEDIKADIETPATRLYQQDGNVDQLVLGILLTLERTKQQLSQDTSSGIDRENTLMAIDTFTVKLVASALQKIEAKPHRISENLITFLENYTGLPASLMALPSQLEQALYQQGTLSPKKQMQVIQKIFDGYFSPPAI